MNQEMEKEKNFLCNGRIKTPGWLVDYKKRRSAQQLSCKSSLPHVTTAEMFYLLEAMLFHIEELSQVEYLVNGLVFL